MNPHCFTGGLNPRAYALAAFEPKAGGSEDSLTWNFCFMLWKPTWPEVPKPCRGF